VGESGSGKTTLGRAIAGLAPVTAGQVLFNGQDITGLRGKEFRRLRPKTEEGPAGQVLDAPGHPYTRALLDAVCEPDPSRRGQRRLLPGEIPSPRNPPPGCAFHPRCRYAQEVCQSVPPITEVAAGHRVGCHFAVTLGEAGPGPARTDHAAAAPGT
jgi:oligopeptide/dipeptide ABC transporter ATP-binding protein